MIKTKQIIQILFLFIILIEKARFQATNDLTDMPTSSTELIITSTDLSDIPSSSTDLVDIPSSSTDSSIFFTDSSTYIESVEKTLPAEGPIEKNERLCKDTQPLKGIKEECFKGNTISQNEMCCYMTVKYETNEHYSCIPVSIDKKSVKEKIKALKQEYEGSKSIDIDCNSSLIRISSISILLIFIF